MSIQSEITRLNSLKNTLTTWANAEGVNTETSPALASLVNSITSLSLVNIGNITSDFSIGNTADGVYIINQGVTVDGKHTIQNNTIGIVFSYGNYKELLTYEGNVEWLDDNRPVFKQYRYDTTASTITSSSSADIFDTLSYSDMQPTDITISGLPSGSTYDCKYYLPLNLVFCRIYVTGKAFAKGTRHIVGTVEEGYRPANRTALATESLQDYSEELRASITSAGEIGFVSSIAKESGDDMYISGWWIVS